MGDIPNSASQFFHSKNMGPAATGVLPPGPDNAFDSAGNETALADEVYTQAYTECAAKADKSALSSVFKFVH